MVINTRNQSLCFFEKLFSINNFKNILANDHPILTKIKEDNTKEYITITLIIEETGSIIYDYCDDFRNKINIFTEDYNNKEFIISLINKILYYYPLIMIVDVDCIPVISKNLVFDHENLDINHYKTRIGRRKEYWDKCYSKYEELYF